MSDPGRMLYGPREDITTPVAIGVHLMDCLARYGDEVAQIQQRDGHVESRTYNDLRRQGQRVAVFLREQGLDSGDTVWVSCGNTLEYTPILLGTLFIGAALAPILPFYDSSDMLHLLGVIQPNLVICGRDAEEALRAAVSQSEVPVNMVPLDTVVEAMSWEGKESVFTLAHVSDPTTHVALVLCSSGTSGKPKGVEISQEMFWRQADFPFYTSKDEATLQRKVVMNLSNPNWVTAQLSFIIALSKRMLLVLLETYSEHDFLTCVAEYKVNYVMLKPFNIVSLAKWPDTELYDTSSLKCVTYGGSPTSPTMVALAQKRLRTQIVTIYGMTETMAICVPAYDHPEKVPSLGTLHTNADAKVIDPETDELLGPNCKGELCLRTPFLMKGYRNNCEATRSVIDKDGFYHTGDVIHYDEDGYLFFHDRIKELIKYKQHQQISAGDIEEVLVSHASVQQVSVVGIPNEIDCEHATAFVVRQPGSDVTAQELLSLVEENLPSYKWLHGGVHFLDSLPKTSTGKILKRELRALKTTL